MKGGLCEIKAGYCVKREWCIVGNVSGVLWHMRVVYFRKCKLRIVGNKGGVLWEI